jgi:hypothetical protein
LADKLQTYTVHLTNAYFGARTDPKDVVPRLDGFDLRLDANKDLILRSIRLIGYDPDHKINWTSMLVAKPAEASTPGAIFVFPRGAAQQISMPLQNYSHLDRPVHYKFQVSGYDDKQVFQTEGDLNIVGGGTTPLNVTFDSSKWLLGPYDGQVDIYLLKTDSQPVISRTFRMGIVTSEALEKARDGEFLYGLDPANNDIFPTHTPNAFAFFRVMGVDILRAPYEKGTPHTTESLQANLNELEKEGVQSSIPFDPPRDSDPVKRAEHLAKLTEVLEEIARKLGGKGPGKAHFFELGNEPDLFAFNPLSMPEFTKEYEAMYDAIKKGSQEAGGAPTDTEVMNGGLSFAGNVGAARAQEFLGTVNPKQIDIIAYHGHGPGIAAERMAYERVLKAAKLSGRTGIPFVETESGVSGTNRPGLVDQARTVVEKMTYAQSVHEPYFMFFRLFMEGTGVERGYGMTDNLVEPRPSVMSYRALVERLRHYHFAKSLDYATEIGADGVNAFLFEEFDPQQKPTGRKTLVAFGENPRE